MAGAGRECGCAGRRRGSRGRLPEEAILEQEGAAHGSGDAGEDAAEVRGAEGFGETGEFRAGGTQPHGDEERLAVVEHATEQAGQALWGGRGVGGPIGIGLGGRGGEGECGGHRCGIKA